MQDLYINEFSDGHRRRGMRKLRAPEKNEVQSILHNDIKNKKLIA